LWLPAVLVVVTNLAAFLLIFRRSLHGHFRLPPPLDPQPGRTTALILVALLALAYLTASAARLPLGLVALGGTMALAAHLARMRRLDVARLAGEVSVSIFG